MTIKGLELAIVNKLRMYCIDTGAIAFMLTEAAPATQLFIQLTPKFAGYIFVIRASDAALPMFDILGGRGSSWAKKGDSLLKIRDHW